MISNGMFDYWLRNEFSKINNLKSSIKNKSNQSDSSNDDVDYYDPIKPLTNSQLQSAYYFFVIGVGVSILSILIEFILFFHLGRLTF